MASIFYSVAFWIFIFGLIVLIIGLALLATSVSNGWKIGVISAGAFIILIALVVWLIEYSYGSEVETDRNIYGQVEVYHNTPPASAVTVAPATHYYTAPAPAQYVYHGTAPAPTYVTPAPPVPTIIHQAPPTPAQYVVHGTPVQSGPTQVMGPIPQVIPQYYNTAVNGISGAYEGARGAVVTGYQGAQQVYAGAQRVGSDVGTAYRAVATDASSAYQAVRPAVQAEAPLAEIPK